MLLRRRLAGMIAALALVTGQVGLCAGWSPLPEARHACCSQGSCPVHAPDGGLEGDIASAADGRPTRHVNQSDADRCCGLSEQRDNPAPSAASSILVVPIGRLTTPVALVVQLAVARPETPASPGPTPFLSTSSFPFCLTPKKGEITFACGMNMLKGTIVVE